MLAFDLDRELIRALVRHREKFRPRRLGQGAEALADVAVFGEIPQRYRDIFEVHDHTLLREPRPARFLAHDIQSPERVLHAPAVRLRLLDAGRVIHAVERGVGGCEAEPFDQRVHAGEARRIDVLLLDVFELSEFGEPFARVLRVERLVHHEPADRLVKLFDRP